MTASRIAFPKDGGLVVYVTIGDPDLATSQAVILAAIDAGANVIELGVPFSDPVADGPVIQRASERALSAGVTLRDVLAVAAEVRRKRTHAGLIVMSYLNPILRYGMEALIKQAANAGIDGVLATDLTFEESDGFRASMKEHGLAPILLAAPTSSEARLKKIGRAAEGFLYAISRTGITGAQQQVADDAKKLVKRLRKHTRAPVALGFGISNAAQFREVTRFADAAVIGSAIVRSIEEHKRDAPAAVADFIKSLRG